MCKVITKYFSRQSRYERETAKFENVFNRAMRTYEHLTQTADAATAEGFLKFIKMVNKDYNDAMGAYKIGANNKSFKTAIKIRNNLSDAIEIMVTPTKEVTHALLYKKQYGIWTIIAFLLAIGNLISCIYSLLIK